MLKKHKNILFNVIRDSEFPLVGRIESYNEDYIDSEFEDSDRDGCFVIHILDTPLSFWVWPISDRISTYHYRCSAFWPNFPLVLWKEEYQSPLKVGSSKTVYYSLEDVARALQRWIDDVVRQYFEEEATDDNWERLKQFLPFISNTTFSQEDLQPFSSEEKEEIRTNLQVFHQLVVDNYNPTEEQLEFIIERLEYLTDAVDRLNHYDWKGVVISTVMGIATNLSVDTNVGAALMRLLQQAFQGIRLFLIQ